MKTTFPVLPIEAQEPTILVGGLSVDDRGTVSYVNEFDFKNVKRSYMVENHKRDFIRSYHYHERESKYVSVVCGTILLSAVKVNKQDLDKSVVKTFTLSSKQPKILWIPPGYANGFKSLEENTKIIFYSTSTLEDSLNDDIRYPFDQWDVWRDDYR
jgi:dTDP-4-dehydrorhamnose 3,5-epimerase